MKGYAPKMPPLTMPKKLPPLKDDESKKAMRTKVMAKLKGGSC